jgi:hypothetical protein
MGWQPIEPRVKKLFWAPTRHRHYATLDQACRAEAGAIIKRQFYEEGGEGMWQDDPEMIVRHRKIASELEASFRANAVK